MKFGYTRRFFGSVSKIPGDADRNEDAFKWSPERSAIALSDGATESFDSKLWAEILVRLFVLTSSISMARVDVAITAFTRRHDPASMSWSRQAAFERGSFATLLGVAFDRGRSEARVLAIGDTVAVLLDGARMVASFPYTRADEFSRRPTLLSTRRALNAFLDRPNHARDAGTIWRLDGLRQPRIVCLTDAMAEWFFRRAEADPCAGEALLGIRTEDELESLVAGERTAGRMRVDDSTILVLE